MVLLAGMNAAEHASHRTIWRPASSSASAADVGCLQCAYPPPAFPPSCLLLPSTYPPSTHLPLKIILGRAELAELRTQLAEQEEAAVKLRSQLEARDAELREAKAAMAAEVAEAAQQVGSGRASDVAACDAGWEVSMVVFVATACPCSFTMCSRQCCFSTFPPPIPGSAELQVQQLLAANGRVDALEAELAGVRGQLEAVQREAEEAHQLQVRVAAAAMCIGCPEALWYGLPQHCSSALHGTTASCSHVECHLPLPTCCCSRARLPRRWLLHGQTPAASWTGWSSCLSRWVVGRAAQGSVQGTQHRLVMRAVCHAVLLLPCSVYHSGVLSTHPVPSPTLVALLQKDAEVRALRQELDEVQAEVAEAATLTTAHAQEQIHQLIAEREAWIEEVTAQRAEATGALRACERGCSGWLFSNEPACR